MRVMPVGLAPTIPSLNDLTSHSLLKRASDKLKFPRKLFHLGGHPRPHTCALSRLFAVNFYRIIIRLLAITSNLCREQIEIETGILNVIALLLLLWRKSEREHPSRRYHRKCCELRFSLLNDRRTLFGDSQQQTAAKDARAVTYSDCLSLFTLHWNKWLRISFCSLRYRPESGAKNKAEAPLFRAAAVS